MENQTQATLRVEPSTIPRLRVAYERAAMEVRELLESVRRSALIPEPWMGDPVSYAVVRLYNGRFATGPNSPYAHLSAYAAELDRVTATLAEMEARYRRTEGDNADLWGRMA